MNDTVTPIQPEKDMEGINPLIADDLGDTADRVKCVLMFIESLEPSKGGIIFDEIHADRDYGQKLIYQSMIQALTVKNLPR
ncbi:MAG: hypothetical protein ABFS24_07615 [Pseudomonadota bacterium]